MPNTVYKVTISTQYEDKAGDLDETTAITCEYERKLFLKLYLKKAFSHKINALQ